MYEELIESCRACATGYDTNCDRCMFCGKNEHGEDSCFQKLHKASADSIEELSKPKWIPVTERLPEINTMVLVMDEAHDMAVGSLEKLWDGEVWVCPFADVDDEQCPITHWMPLPEPPKEDKA